MGVLKTTVHRWIVGLTICVHCNSHKPVLTEENKVARLLMALHFRDPVDLTKYFDMLDRIHLDEKWFFLTQKKERYLLPVEKLQFSLLLIFFCPEILNFTWLSWYLLLKIAWLHVSFTAYENFYKLSKCIVFSFCFPLSNCQKYQRTEIQQSIIYPLIH